MMRPLEDLPAAGAQAIRAVFADLDDTLTSDGLLEAEAFEALWTLHRSGRAAVIVTGRPAGWCDHFARMWPIAGVVGENGAFYYRLDRTARRLVRRFVLGEEERRGLQSRLAAVRDRILREVPRSRVASDQDHRIHDLAIDFCEDVDPPLPREEIDRIVALFEAAGATAKVSSIHVNGWFGSYDKLGMIRRFASEVLGLELDRAEDRLRAAYAGDSPNDEPAFAFFQETSVGVANVRRFADRLRAPPAWVTREEGGRGFAELVRKITRGATPTP
jgi:HAD superfamily hydrolase (TIGR01484 family)